MKPADYLSLHIPAVGNPVMMSQSEGLDKRGEENQGTIKGDAKPQAKHKQAQHIANRRSRQGHAARLSQWHYKGTTEAKL